MRKELPISEIVRACLLQWLEHLERMGKKKKTIKTIIKKESRRQEKKITTETKVNISSYARHAKKERAGGKRQRIGGDGKKL